MSRVDYARWEQVWLAEAIRLAEESGPLDDSLALARVQRLSLPERDKLLDRAWQLGQRLGWPEQFKRLREFGWLLALLVAGAVLAMANGLLFSVLAEGRTINAASGFVSALGVHAVTLVLWLLSIPIARRTGRSLSIGHWLTAAVFRLPFWRNPQNAALTQAGRSLIARERLAPWAFGLVSHLVWAFGFAFMLLGLLFAFAFREYQLTWETTILAPDWFAAFARVTGYLPGLLGVPVPSPAVQAGAAQSAGAWPAREAAAWLLASVALYGLLPRALCAAWCAWMLRRAARRVDIDLADPYYQQLRARLQALEQAEITDKEHPAQAVPRPARSSGAAHAGFAVLGFELVCDDHWLPAALQPHAAMAVCIAGTMPEQMQVHAQLASVLPARLLVICNPHASPDRGTLRFLREAGSTAQQCALAFSVAPENRAGTASASTASTASTATAATAATAEALRSSLERWKTWMQAGELRHWQVFDKASAAADWALEAGL